MKEQREKNINTVVVFIGILPLLYLIYLALVPVISIVQKDIESRPMRIISDKLKVRSEKSKNGYTIGQYGYGTEVKVYETHKDWAEVSVEDIKGYMAMEYLVTPEQFYLINGVYGNDEAKKALPKTQYRKAVASYLSDNGFTTNISKSIKAKLYGSSDNREERLLFVEPGNPWFNSYAYGDFNGDKSEDAAYIFTNPKNGKRFLVILELSNYLPDKYSKLLYTQELDNDFTFIKLAHKQYSYKVNGHTLRLKVDGLLLGSNRDKSFKDNTELLLYDGQSFNFHLQ